MFQKCISSERDEFHSLVFAVVHKAVVPEVKMLQGEESLSDASVKDVLTKSVTELCTNLNWLTSLTPKQGFCWGIVAACSAKIPVRVDSLLWLQDYNYLMNQLCHIYKAYCSAMNLQGAGQTLLKDEFPANVRQYNDIRM